MPVRAFIDDSGSGGDSRFFVLGGFMANFETWERFSDDWDATLSTAPAIAYFKMAEANSLNQQFEGWSDNERNEKVNALIDVIDRHGLFQGTCAIEASDYNAVVKPVLGNVLNGEYDDPYLYLFMGIVSHFAAMEHRWEYAQRDVPPSRIVIFDETAHTGQPPQPVDFVFDEGKRLTDRAARSLYETSLKNLNVFSDRLGSVDFRDDKKFVPLQAADLAAWQRRRRLCARHEAERSDYARLHRRQGRFKHTQLYRSDLVDTINDVLDGLRKRGQM